MAKSLYDSIMCPPPELHGPAQREFAARVDRVVAEFPEAFPTSYYRTPERNAAVGGQPESLHTEALAADLDFLGADAERLNAVGRYAVEVGLSAIVYWGSGKSYVHLQARPLRSGNRLSFSAT